MIVQDVLAVDRFAIYEVPVPEEFRYANGEKRVIVTLAYDPPVRHRRQEYLGIKMDYSLFRGKHIDEIVEAYRQISQAERVAATDAGDEIPKALKGRFRCELDPGPKALESSTLQRSEWNFTREKYDSGDSWYLLVRSRRVWAPDSFVEQRFAVAVTLQADEPRLYTLVRDRVRVRQQQRTRARV